MPDLSRRLDVFITAGQGHDRDRAPLVDLLWASRSLCEGINDNATEDEIIRNSPAAPAAPDQAVLYPRAGWE